MGMNGSLRKLWVVQLRVFTITPLLAKLIFSHLFGKDFVLEHLFAILLVLMTISSVLSWYIQHCGQRRAIITRNYY